MKNMFKVIGLSVSLAVTGLAVSETSVSPIQSQAQAQAGTTLDQLLSNIRQAGALSRQENQDRLARFRSARNQQAALLNQTKADIAREEARSEQLEATFNENDEVLGELELQLADRLGVFGELFGTARQVAGDTRGQLNNSLVSAQIPGRAAIVDEIATSKALPTMGQLRELWFIMQQEMTEQGKVASFDAPVRNEDGEMEQATVVRVGPFSAVADSRFVNYNLERRELEYLVRQPSASFLGAADDLQDADPGELVQAAIDPSSGAILSLLVQTPNLVERVNQGGIVGYIVIGLAGLGLLIGITRTLALTSTASSVRSQAKKRKASKSNPLGRVFMAYEENANADVETLELKLDDAILKEMPKLEKGLNTLKVLAGVAPLLGLLGTVTGMIQTFQAITLFGTGDPKLMAGGISQALVTTVLGLVAAIPLLLLHSLASGRAKIVQQILEEQAAGLVAAQAEGR